MKESYKDGIEFGAVCMMHVSDGEASLCGDDDVTSASRTPTIIGDGLFSGYNTQLHTGLALHLRRSSVVTWSMI